MKGIRDVSQINFFCGKPDTKKYLSTNHGNVNVWEKTIYYYSSWILSQFYCLDQIKNTAVG